MRYFTFTFDESLNGFNSDVNSTGNEKCSIDEPANNFGANPTIRKCLWIFFLCVLLTVRCKKNSSFIIYEYFKLFVSLWCTRRAISPIMRPRPSESIWNASLRRASEPFQLKNVIKIIDNPRCFCHNTSQNSDENLGNHKAQSECKNNKNSPNIFIFIPINIKMKWEI
jgi:hypothetical protein